MDENAYKELLIKYVQHVMAEEGTSFISKANNGWKESPTFNQEELGELQQAGAEAYRRWRVQAGLPANGS